MQKSLAVTGAGNAIVDVIVHADDHMLASESFDKGSSALIDEARQQVLLKSFPQNKQFLASGGSVANSIDVIASLHANTGILTRLGLDRYGDHFLKDLIDRNVQHGQSIQVQGKTGVSLVITTPDGQRTMRTAPGVSGDFSPNDVHKDLIEQAEWLFLEGYLLLNGKDGLNAVHAALDYAEQSGTKVALTLASEFVASNYQTELQDIIDRSHLIVGNKEESLALTGAQSADAAFQTLANTACDLAISDGPHGVRICFQGKESFVPVFKPSQIVSTVGAGDTLAGGMLFGLVQKVDPEKAVLGGCYLASQVLQQDDARLTRDYLSEWSQIQSDSIAELRQKGWQG